MFFRVVIILMIYLFVRSFVYGFLDSRDILGTAWQDEESFSNLLLVHAKSRHKVVES
jgi:hypothetical protein